jgi:hypothetical protein
MGWFIFCNRENLGSLTAMRTLVRLFVYGGTLALAVLLVVPALLHACAVCLGSSDNDPVTDAFNWSVLFMMATPYATFGVVAGLIFYNHRRAGAAEPEGAQENTDLSQLATDQEGE